MIRGVPIFSVRCGEIVGWMDWITLVSLKTLLADPCCQCNSLQPLGYSQLHKLAQVATDYKIDLFTVALLFRPQYVAPRSTFFFRNTTPCNKPIEQPVSNKIASLLGKLLNICVDRLCLKFSKIRIGDREKLARKTDRALGELGLTAEKRAKPCRGRAATRTPSSTRERTAEKRKELCRSSKSTSTRNWTPIWPRTPRQEKYGSFVPRYEIEIALGSN
jgi:hypothetical protein